jgi:hypothetical protein
MSQHGGNGSLAMGAGHSHTPAGIKYLSQGYRSLDHTKSSPAKIVQLLMVIRNRRCIDYKGTFRIPKLFGNKLRPILIVDINSFTL